MFKRAEACRPLTSSRHGSVVVRRVPRSSRHSLLAPPARRQWCPKAPARLVEGMSFRTLSSRTMPFGQPAPSRTPSVSLARKLARAPVPRRPSSSRSRIALCELERLASFEARPLSYDPVFRFLDAPWRVGFGPRPWTALALVSMSFDGGARQARSTSPHGGPDAPLARLTYSGVVRHGNGER